MKFKYLGTAAAEGFPAVFCNCEYCNAARRKGGKNIRTRSQAVIDDDLLIDFPSDTYAHALYNGLNLGKIKHLLVTHSHMDHFVPQEFELRGICFAHDMPEKEITVYCNDTVKDLFFHINAGKINQNVLNGIRFFTGSAVRPVSSGGVYRNAFACKTYARRTELDLYNRKRRENSTVRQRYRILLRRSFRIYRKTRYPFRYDFTRLYYGQ